MINANTILKLAASVSMIFASVGVMAFGLGIYEKYRD